MPFDDPTVTVIDYDKILDEEDRRAQRRVERMSRELAAITPAQMRALVRQELPERNLWELSESIRNPHRPRAKRIVLDPAPTRPLTKPDIKRIVRAYREAGRLFADNLRFGGTTPHGAVDHYLGAERKFSCPCNVGSRKDRRFLKRLEDWHEELALARSGKDEVRIAYCERRFGRLLAD